VKAILLGATGMVGQGVLRECLLDPEVESVLTIGRNATIHKHEKLHEIVVNDLSDLTSTEGSLSGTLRLFVVIRVDFAIRGDHDAIHLARVAGIVEFCAPRGRVRCIHRRACTLAREREGHPL
jgi:putative NADH-flavin reductase